MVANGFQKILFRWCGSWRGKRRIAETNSGEKRETGLREREERGGEETKRDSERECVGGEAAARRTSCTSSQTRCSLVSTMRIPVEISSSLESQLTTAVHHSMAARSTALIRSKSCNCDPRIVWPRSRDVRSSTGCCMFVCVYLAVCCVCDQGGLAAGTARGHSRSKGLLLLNTARAVSITPYAADSTIDVDLSKREYRDI